MAGEQAQVTDTDDIDALAAEWDRAVASAGGDESEVTSSGGDNAAAGEGAGAEGAGAAADEDGAAKKAEEEARAKAAQDDGAKPPPGKENWVPQTRLSAEARAKREAIEREKARTAERDKALQELEALKSRLAALEAGRAQPGATAGATKDGEPDFDMQAFLAGKDQPEKPGEDAPAAAAPKSDEVKALEAKLARMEEQLTSHGQHFATQAEREQQVALKTEIEDVRVNYTPDVPWQAYAKAFDAIPDGHDIDLYKLGELWRAAIDAAKAKFPEIEEHEPGFFGAQYAANPRANLMAIGAAAQAQIDKFRRGWDKRPPDGQPVPGTKPAVARPAGMGAPQQRKPPQEEGPQTWDEATEWATREWNAAQQA